MTSKIRSEVIIVTPEIAKQFLDFNQGNRKVRQSQVDFLANSMVRGEWVLTHQGIAISKDGVLIDGQHRLLAVVKANMAIPMMATYGLDRVSAFPAIDGGFVLRNDADRIGVDRRVIEVAKFIAMHVFRWYGVSKSRKFTHGQLSLICNVVEELHDKLMEYCSSYGKFTSSSVVRTAAISSVLLGHDMDYVFSMYRNLVLSSLDELPPCGKSIIKQVMTGTILSGKDMKSLENYAKMMYVFDKKNADTSKVSVRNHIEYVDNVRKELIKKFPFIEYSQSDKSDVGDNRRDVFCNDSQSIGVNA